MNKSDWVWMPHAAHFVGRRQCQFFLATYVGGYIVSTVGEWDPQNAGVLTKLGASHIYETLVFTATPDPQTECCPWSIADDVDDNTYNKAGDAYRGHLAMCEKWADLKLRPSGECDEHEV